MTFLANKNSNDLDLFPSFFGNWLDDGFKSDMAYAPRVNISESDTSYHLEAELPGVKQEDINLHFEKGILSISGEKKEEFKDEKKNYIRRESRVGKFTRSFQVSEQVDPEGIKANFSDGVLKVDLPKREGIQPKSIPINS